MTGPEGQALAQTSGTSSWPAARAASMKPVIARLIPAVLAKHRLAARQRRPAVGLLEALEGRGLRREAVGLVVQAADPDPGHRLA